MAFINLNKIKNTILSSRYSQIRKELDDTKKNLKIAMDGIIKPPTADIRYRMGHHVYGRYPYYNRLYEMAYNSDVLTAIQNALRREIFRNGYDLVEAKKTDEETTSSEEETEPEEKITRKQILDFLEDINENSQNVTDVLFELEDDFSVMDDAFMLFIYTYEFGNDLKLVGKKLKQVQRMDPRVTGLVMNKYDRPGFDDDDKELFVCPLHRETLLEDKSICNACGRQAYRAHFFIDYDGKRLYYFKDEVVFKSKYRPSKRRGYPPIFTVWTKTLSLSGMDEYIKALYVGQRPPKAGLFFKTSNQDAITSAWDKVKQKANEHPHLPIVMAVPDSTSGKGFVEFIDFMKSLDEMQYTEARQEMKRQIGAVYGVEPLFQGDMSQSGGLNNEGLQITVTNRAVEFGQGIYNTHFLPKILEAMGAEGWTLELNPSEEQDEAARLERQAVSLSNGRLALDLGLSAKYDKDIGEVIIEEGNLELQETEGDGLFGPKDPESFRRTGSPAEQRLTDKMILKLANQRPPFTKLAKVLEKEISKFIKIFKRKPTEKELKAKIRNIKSNLAKELGDSTTKLFKKTYSDSVDKIGKELNVNFTFDKVDENALKAIATQPVLSEAFEGISKDLSTKLNVIIKEAFEDPKGLSLQKIQEKIKDATSVSDFRAEQISRTETSLVASAARRNSYKKADPEGEFIYKHVGPADLRTTFTSKRIKARTKNGVKWDRYVEIVKEESSKEFPTWKVDPEWPLSHFSSRHGFVRMVTP